MDLRWELDLWGCIRRGQEAFSAEALGSEMNRRGLLLSLVCEVGQSYSRLREPDEQIEIAERNLALQQDSLSIIRSRAQAGLVSDLDVKREETLVGLLKKAVSGVLAMFPCSRTGSTLCAQK
ncbi:MAG: TolC family protein [Nitrospirales bacterium]